MKMIWAVVRSSKIDAITRSLKKIGVSGCTVYPVRGYGDQWNLYEPLLHGGHYKLETIVQDEQVENVVKQIAANAWTGDEGDGVLTFFDLVKVVQIKLEKELTKS